MDLEALVDRLAAHKLIGGVPRRELRWLAEHGHLRHINAGDVLALPTEPVESLVVVLSGRFAIHVKRGGALRKGMEWQGGDVGGLLPYSRMKRPPGATVAKEPTEVLELRQEDFPELIRECYGLTSVFVHVMLDRARHFTSDDYHDEKMRSLGHLSAGLAHELNNPASAVTRGASVLDGYIAELDTAARALGGAGLSAAQVDAIDRLRAEPEGIPASTIRSPLEQADREDAVGRWLAARGLDESLAEGLADSPYSLPDLDSLAVLAGPEHLPVVLRYMVAESGARTVCSEVRSAAARIHDLVSAIRRFSYLDQASVPKSVDLVQGIEDTLKVLHNKARTRSIQLSLHLEPGLPHVQGFGGELNQIWSNLVDNALDAAPRGGHVEVTAARDGASVVVRVIDDGPGISAENCERIFDPFFTTKPVGQGTGLGLDIAFRLVQRHDGEIEVVSRPGRTEFIVVLPIAGPSGPAGDGQADTSRESQS